MLGKKLLIKIKVALRAEIKPNLICKAVATETLRHITKQLTDRNALHPPPKENRTTFPSVNCQTSAGKTR